MKKINLIIYSIVLFLLFGFSIQGQQLIKTWSIPAANFSPLATNLDLNEENFHLDLDNKPDIPSWCANDSLFDAYINSNIGEVSTFKVDAQGNTIENTEFIGYHTLIPAQGEIEKQIVLANKKRGNVVGVLIGIFSEDEVNFFRPELGDEVIVIKIKDYNNDGLSEIIVYNTITSEMECWKWME